MTKNLEFSSRPLMVLLQLMTICMTQIDSKNPTVTSSAGWDPSLPDPFLGVKITKGYITIPTNSTEIIKKQHFVYVHNKNNLTNPPLIISNPGGPGISSLFMLVTAAGPYVFNPDSKTISVNNSTEQLTEYADVLQAEYPLGDGFSISSQIITNLTENALDNVQFLKILGKEHPQLNIDKKRDIYLYGVSYGGSTMPTIGKALHENNYNVKGLHVECPYSNFTSLLKESPNYYFENIPMCPQTKMLWATMGHFCEFMYKYNIYGYGSTCSNLQTVVAISFSGFRVSLIDLRPSRIWPDINYMLNLLDVFNTENTRIVFGGEDVMTFTGDITGGGFMFNNQKHPFDYAYQYLLDNNIPVNISEGEYDFPCNLPSLLDWVQNLDYAKKSFDVVDWVDSQFGKVRKWGLLSQEVVKDAGHFVSYNRPEIVYNKIKELINFNKYS